MFISLRLCTALKILECHLGQGWLNVEGHTVNHLSMEQRNSFTSNVRSFELDHSHPWGALGRRVRDLAKLRLPASLEELYKIHLSVGSREALNDHTMERLCQCLG